nr:carbon-nitrogen hydrolase family protein [Candidatus Sigynarchaeota archaeon]
MSQVTIACLQLASIPFDHAENLRKATAMIQDAARRGADIVVLPEVFNPGYSLLDDNYARSEPLDGQTITTLVNLAAALNIYISGGIGEKSNEGFFNAMFFIGPDGLKAVYHKNHVASLENKYWQKGTDVAIIESKFGKIGLGICADMQYTDVWQRYAGKVDLILICSAWGTPEKNTTRYGKHEDQQCKELPVQVSRVLQVPVAYCNAAHECKGEIPIVKKMRCLGFSKIVDKGRVAAEIASRDEKIVLATVQLDGEHPVVDRKAFKRWLTFGLTEKLPRFFVETVGSWYGRRYYRHHARKWQDQQGDHHDS